MYILSSSLPHEDIKVSLPSRYHLGESLTRSGNPLWCPYTLPSPK